MMENGGLHLQWRGLLRWNWYRNDQDFRRNRTDGRLWSVRQVLRREMDLVGVAWSIWSDRYCKVGRGPQARLT